MMPIAPGLRRLLRFASGSKVPAPRTMLVLGILANVGCGSHPETWPVSGKVQFADGTPVARGVIEFAPADGGSTARAPLGADGSFVLKTGDRAGAVAGLHRVAILQTASAEDIPAHQHKHAPLRAVPGKYRRFETSGLEHEIPIGGARDIVIRIKAP
jgi:hypothetical protein